MYFRMSVKQFKELLQMLALEKTEQQLPIQPNLSVIPYCKLSLKSFFIFFLTGHWIFQIYVSGTRVGKSHLLIEELKMYHNWFQMHFWILRRQSSNYPTSPTDTLPHLIPWDCLLCQTMSLSAVAVDVAVGDRCSVEPAWSVDSFCPQCESLGKKSTLIWKIRGSLFHNVIFAFCVKIVVPLQQLECFYHLNYLHKKKKMHFNLNF